MLGKIDGKRKRGAAEDEMVRYHHQLNKRAFDRIAEDRGACHAAVHGVTESRT